MFPQNDKTSRTTNYELQGTGWATRAPVAQTLQSVCESCSCTTYTSRTYWYGFHTVECFVLEVSNHINMYVIKKYYYNELCLPSPGMFKFNSPFYFSVEDNEPRMFPPPPPPPPPPPESTRFSNSNRTLFQPCASSFLIISKSSLNLPHSFSNTDAVS